MIVLRHNDLTTVENWTTAQFSDHVVEDLPKLSCVSSF